MTEMKKMSMKDKLHTGQIYYPSGDEIMDEQLQCLDRLYDFNRIRSFPS